jgi:hypothetical protein
MRLFADLWDRNSEVSTNLADQEVVDVAMPWHRGSLIIARVKVETVLATFTK